MPVKNLVIVESPAKAKTISRFLGKDYKILASYGHVRDLPKSKMGINVKTDFAPQYIQSTNPVSKKALKEIKDSYSDTTSLYIATDEDREGEAIGWHICEVLKPKNEKNVHRIVFHEITENAILNSLKNPRKIDIALVNAQQARRVLDRIVGYVLSPFLWRKIQAGLSAGRVQSVAARIVCEKEKEIRNHREESFFNLVGSFKTDKSETFNASYDNKMAKSKDAKSVLEELSKQKFKITNIEFKKAIKNPPPPFTTSTLQQEAARKLGYSVKKTMIIAQKLYETGKITYMRTDSLSLASEALSMIEKFIIKEYGANYHKFRQYKTKSKGAQEAHEAIRPTNIGVVDTGESRDEKRLYDVIRKRTLASQMKEAILNKVVVSINSDDAKHGFEAKGETIVFDGYMKAYREEEEEDADNVLLPNLKEGSKVELFEAVAKETYKKPPFRYSEASLVRKLEEMGIGRPSTYAPTISTIQDRGYITKQDFDGDTKKISVLTLTDGQITEETKEEVFYRDKNKLFPTPIGMLVNDFLTKHFPEIVDYKFTANVEKEFDDIALDKVVWNVMIKNFYTKFIKHIDIKNETVTRKEATNTRVIGTDPKSGKPISARIGRYGPYVQIGVAEDEEKPTFAKIPDKFNLETITLAQALELFKLPRTVGVDDNGTPIQANVGRFGPYIKINNSYISIKGIDPMEITLEEAKKLIIEKAIKDKEKTIKEFENSTVKILMGQYSPYVTDGKKNVKIPKEIKEYTTLTIEYCDELLKQKTFTRKFSKAKGRSRRK